MGGLEDKRVIFGNYSSKDTSYFFPPQNQNFNIRIVSLFFIFRMKLIQANFLFRWAQSWKCTEQQGWLVQRGGLLKYPEVIAFPPQIGKGVSMFLLVSLTAVVTWTTQQARLPHLSWCSSVCIQLLRTWAALAWSWLLSSDLAIFIWLMLAALKYLFACSIASSAGHMWAGGQWKQKPQQRSAAMSSALRSPGETEELRRETKQTKDTQTLVGHAVEGPTSEVLKDTCRLVDYTVCLQMNIIIFWCTRRMNDLDKENSRPDEGSPQGPHTCFTPNQTYSTTPWQPWCVLNVAKCPH